MVLYLIVSAIIILIDQLTKWLIVRNLDLYQTISVVGEFFKITSDRNRGAAFSILQDQRWFFIVITIVVTAGLVFYLRKMIADHKRLLSVALSLILGGAVGNFIDRALHGEVVDFLMLHFKFTLIHYKVDYIFPIFNIADSAIVIGVSLIFIHTWIEWRNESKSKEVQQ